MIKSILRDTLILLLFLFLCSLTLVVYYFVTQDTNLLPYLLTLLLVIQLYPIIGFWALLRYQNQ